MFQLRLGLSSVTISCKTILPNMSKSIRDKIPVAHHVRLVEMRGQLFDKLRYPPALLWR